jgi:AraC-like DNA-binding protein
MEGWSHLSREHSITLIGMCDRPSIVDTESDDRAGTIGIEFSPRGAYRFFQLSQGELTNRIYNLGDVLGKTAVALERSLANTALLQEKIELIESFLLRSFRKSEDDTIFNYCVNRIRSTTGSVSVKDLERETGYSSRWLNMKFDQRVGISPKNLCAITRFQYCYQALAQAKTKELFDNKGHGLYYDQSHFIKAFKRFTGVPPKKFADANNEFGKIFYKT